MLAPGRGLAHLRGLEGGVLVMAGWIVAVLVETDGEPVAVRHFYALGFEDRAKAEWTAVDHALREGAVATSPLNGQEPVQAICPIAPAIMNRLGLNPGQVRALGGLWPRRWISPGAVIAQR